MTFLWSANLEPHTITEWVHVNPHTTVDWCHYLHEVNTMNNHACSNYHSTCGQYLDRTSEPLGGPGVIVEMDEAKFGRWKYHQGCYVDGHWVLGGIERGMDKTFFVPVPQRDSGMMLNCVREQQRLHMSVMQCSLDLVTSYMYGGNLNDV